MFEQALHNRSASAGLGGRVRLDNSVVYPWSNVSQIVNGFGIMKFLDKLIGVPRRRLKAVTVSELRYSTSKVDVRIKGMSAYEDPETPDKLLQSGDFALELAGQVCDYISDHGPIAPTQDYTAVLSPNETEKIELTFRIYKPADAASVSSDLNDALSEAFQKHGIDFVGFR